MIKLSVNSDNNGVKEMIICVFTDSKKILNLQKKINNWDNLGIYRSS